MSSAAYYNSAPPNPPDHPAPAYPAASASYPPPGGQQPYQPAPDQQTPWSGQQHGSQSDGKTGEQRGWGGAPEMQQYQPPQQYGPPPGRELAHSIAYSCGMRALTTAAFLISLRVPDAAWRLSRRSSTHAGTGTASQQRVCHGRRTAPAEQLAAAAAAARQGVIIHGILWHLLCRLYRMVSDALLLHPMRSKLTVPRCLVSSCCADMLC